MGTWVLVFYISSGFLQSATGGPSTIQGMESEAHCLRTMDLIKQKHGSKFDNGFCFDLKSTK